MPKKPRENSRFNCVARIFELEHDAGWNDYQLAKNTGIPRSSISRWSLHEDSQITVATIEKLCDSLGITLADFFSQEQLQDPETGQLARISQVLAPRDRRMLLRFAELLLGLPAGI